VDKKMLRQLADEYNINMRS